MIRDSQGLYGVTDMTTVAGTYSRLTEDAQARIAFMRFGLGPKPGSRGRIGTGPDAAYQACLAELNAGAAKITDDKVVVRSAPPWAPFNGNPFPATIANCGAVAANRLSGNYNLAILDAEEAARYVKYLQPEVGFLERLVLFWNNHFSVYNGKARSYVGHMERVAIRQNVLGKFEDMLIAVTRHPAMISYLDNWSSYGPNCNLAKKYKNRVYQYNENLAREILELHTVGVNGGYSQADVTEFAKVLTGWHVGSDGQFKYNPDAHEPGSFTVMKTVYAQSTGEEQTMAVLKSLANSQATAKHIAYKLVRHFITDTPSKRDVNNLSRVYLKTGGDLLAVSKALLKLPSAWSTPFTRVRPPYHWLVSLTRGMGMTEAQVVDSAWRYRVFSLYMGHMPWWRVTPDGWPDDSSYWKTPDAVRIRNDIALKLVTTGIQAVRQKPAALADDLLGGGVSTTLKSQFVDLARDPPTSLSTIFASPEYLRS